MTITASRAMVVIAALCLFVAALLSFGVVSGLPAEPLAILGLFFWCVAGLVP